MTTERPSLLVRLLLERLADDGLPSFLARPLHARMRRTPAWSAWYGLQRRAERGVLDDAPPLSAGQHALLRQLVLDDPRLTEPTGHRGWWVGAAVAAAIAVIVVIPRGGPDTPPDDDAFVARGAALQLRVRCVEGGAVVGDVLASTAPAALSCRDGALLAIAARNSGPSPRRVVVEVVRDDVATRPVPALTLPAGGVDVLADDAIRLDGPGRRTLRLVDLDAGPTEPVDARVVVVDVVAAGGGGG